MIRNDQVYTNLTLWPVFPPSKYSPIFSPLPYPTSSITPDSFTRFFSLLAPLCPLNACWCGWSYDDYLWRNRRPIAIGFGANLNYDLQFSQNLSIMVHYGDQELILEEPSLSLWHCICIWHSMGFRWNERDTAIFTSSYMNAMHQSNPLSLSCYQGNLLTNCCNVGTAVSDLCRCSGVDLR